MLAIKECLIREGVLNLDSPPRHAGVSALAHAPPLGPSRQQHQHFLQLQSSKSSGNMDMPRYRYR